MFGYFVTFSPVNNVWKLYQRNGLSNCCYIDSFNCKGGSDAQIRAAEKLGFPVEIH